MHAILLRYSGTEVRLALNLFAEVPITLLFVCIHRILALPFAGMGLRVRERGSYSDKVTACMVMAMGLIGEPSQA